MKINIDPMGALRQAKVDVVNEAFNKIASLYAHRDQAHAQKRQAARNVMMDPAHDTPEFTSEATLRGITPAALAALVLSKPDNVAQRELHRQKIMAKIAAAATPADLDALSVTAT
jgi:hypothetical protein